MGMSSPSTPPPAPASMTSLASQLQRADGSMAGHLTRQDKRKRASEFDSVNPPLIDSESLIVAFKGEAREAQAEHVALERWI